MKRHLLRKWSGPGLQAGDKTAVQTVIQFEEEHNRWAGQKKEKKDKTQKQETTKSGTDQVQV